MMTPHLKQDQVAATLTVIVNVVMMIAAIVVRGGSVYLLMSTGIVRLGLTQREGAHGEEVRNMVEGQKAQSMLQLGRGEMIGMRDVDFDRYPCL